jgi:hypothetical protein
MSDPFPLNTDPPKSRAMRSSTAAAAFLRRSQSDFVNGARSMLRGASTAPVARGASSYSPSACWIVFPISVETAPCLAGTPPVVICVEATTAFLFRPKPMRELPQPFSVPSDIVQYA